MFGVRIFTFHDSLSGVPKIFICNKFIIILLLILHYSEAFMENKLTGTPEVQCEGRKLSLVIATEKSFDGKVYAKGMFEKGHCSFDYSKKDGLHHKNITKIYVTLDYNKCNTERIRTLQPSGVTYMNTVVVQFHETFITTADKAYHVRCFYSEIEKTVESGFDVSMIPTDPLERELTMPSCQYSVRRATANGPIVKSAQVGDIVYHRWDCNGNTEVYGMLVHSCIVENEKGGRNSIINSRGCTVDKGILPNLFYNRELNLAYAKSKVFKFPDDSFIHFKCQIMICTKVNDQCARITPPECDYARKTRALAYSPDDPNMDVISDKILVVQDTEQDYFVTVDSATSQQVQNEESFFNFPQSGDDYNYKQHLKSCTSRILLICTLVGFVVFLATSIVFMLYILSKQPQAKSTNTIIKKKKPKQIESPHWTTDLHDFMYNRKSDYQ